MKGLVIVVDPSKSFRTPTSDWDPVNLVLEILPSTHSQNKTKELKGPLRFHDGSKSWDNSIMTDTFIDYVTDRDLSESHSPPIFIR